MPELVELLLSGSDNARLRDRGAETVKSSLSKEVFGGSKLFALEAGANSILISRGTIC